MSEIGAYFEKNKKAWNAMTPYHIASEFYNQKEFLNGKQSLNQIELDLLGDIRGKKILHLQCHFGQDTISLYRLGAHVTGVDFSDEAIDAARATAKQLHLNADFICTNIFDLPEVLSEKFDIVFTSYGVLGWLPDMKKWAELVAHFLKPSGRLVLVEFHPVIWMLDNNFEKIAYDYFVSNPIIETMEGTYANRQAPISNENVSWNHGLAEVLGNLLQTNFRIDSFEEFDYSPYPCFHGMIEEAPQKFRIGHIKHRIPMIYSLSASLSNK